MHHAVLLLVPLGSVAVNIFLIYADSVTDMGLIIINLGFLLMDFLVFYLYYVLSEALWERQENASLRRQLESYSDQMQLLEESSEKVKALRHDMKHHMNEIRLMAKQDRTREIQNYMEQECANQEADSEAEPEEASEREHFVSEKYAAYRNRKQQRWEDRNRTGQIPYYKGR